MLGLDTPSASANSPSVSGPREFSDPSAATTETECSPSVSRLRRRTIRMRATRRLPATSAGVPMVAENWLGILISLHNQYEVAIRAPRANSIAERWVGTVAEQIAAFLKASAS